VVAVSTVWVWGRLTRREAISTSMVCHPLLRLTPGTRLLVFIELPSP
jgi:hypothetical protein